jgi:opacity protein-like surface antigen
MLKFLRYPFIPGLLLSLASVGLSGQDLDSLLQASLEEKTEYTTATFKATRILNGHSIERMTEGQMDVRISHRFGTINSGAYEFFGLDQAHIHLGVEYGITDWIMVGLGRGTFEKTIDGFTKISLLRQSTGLKEMPVSISYMAGMYINGLRWSDPELDNHSYQRLSYAHQILIGRKFSPAFSLQLTPSYLHQNLVETATDPNDLFAIGAGTRLKLSKRISVNAEYFYLFKPDNETLSSALYNPFSLGVDIETGGHVFQIIMTNSVGMRENAFLGHTTGRWLDGDIHLGFNVSRVFQLKK